MRSLIPPREEPCGPVKLPIVPTGIGAPVAAAADADADDDDVDELVAAPAGDPVELAEEPELHAVAIRAAAHATPTASILFFCRMTLSCH
jgi:hypothetical protein